MNDGEQQQQQQQSDSTGWMRNRISDQPHMEKFNDDITTYTSATTVSSSSSSSGAVPARVFSPTTFVDPNNFTNNTNENNNKTGRLGTINGVFLPCLQTILGVILFLRLTSITSQAGCIHTTAIILTCVTSTFLTALSLSAIATNGTICAGGPYYVISRTLGVEIGGALGLLFYLGTAVASSMYVLGAVEAVQSTARLGFGHAFSYDTQMASLMLMFLIASVVTVGVKYVNMTSSLFLGLVLLSIFCMCLGCILFAFNIFSGELNPWDRVYFDNIWPHYEPDPITGLTPDFFSLVALFFPSVTGILAGSNRSAVLADPAKSIPRGTIGAISVTTFIYIFVVWLFGLTISNPTLKIDKFVVSSVAFPQEQVVKIGVIMSCIGAALQCQAGAPRLLAAIAMDDTIPFLRFVKPRAGDDPSATPMRAVWATWFIASVPTLAGNLDHITPIITMFFLLMYSGINFSCFLLGVVKSPGFRPTFKYFHWSVSLFGFVWCLGLALVINWFTALGSVSLFFMLYVYNKKQKTNKDWGDVGDAVRYNIVTSVLRALTGTTTEHLHAKNWRPQLLTIVDSDDCGNPTNLHVLSLASQLKKGRGINMVVSIMSRTDGLLLGGFERYETCDLVQNSKSLLQQHMRMEGMDGFAEVSATSSSYSEAVWSAVIHTGLGPLSPNAVMLSFPDRVQRSRMNVCGDSSVNGESSLSSKNGVDSHTSNTDDSSKNINNNNNWGEEYLTTIRGIMNMQKAVILFRGSDLYPSNSERLSGGSIDVWWVVHDGGLLLLLPYVLSKNVNWGRSGAKLRLFAVTTSPTENPDRLREAVMEHLALVRISASVVVVDMSQTNIAEDMREVGGGSGVALSSENSTRDRTVGEVFSNVTYDIPYQTLLGGEDMEQGGIIIHGGHGCDSGCAETVPALMMMGGHHGGMMEDVESPADLSNPTTLDVEGNRMKTATEFNSLLRMHSKKASLVVMNMPLIRAGEPAEDFFGYVDAVCDGIDNVLLVRGSGNEVITTYA